MTIFFTQEAERDSSKKWNPVVEMQYRGGRYKGRCQGGLPEGKVNSYKSFVWLNYGSISFFLFLVFFPPLHAEENNYIK